MNLALELSEIEKQVSDLISENIEYKKQLAKATEIIEGYMLFCKGETTHYKAIEKQAEQFLKENK